MIRDAILDCSNRKDLVLDPFCGSGTTLIAAHETGRIGRGIEIDPVYCDVIVNRMADICGLTISLLPTGESFEHVEEQRRRASDQALPQEDAA